jgi:hypothetical protein
MLEEKVQEQVAVIEHKEDVIKGERSKADSFQL